ncbi:AAA family ATPase [Fulvivirga kasyanovii]|uniref:AAA family ATPase n=2 Tax=Fulvivirga kasyanovii TaxID=396812 RepID=A0ABW9RKL5_9BACT|nr:AAA family ATPase [Fulvivirga kasyanovii]
MENSDKSTFITGKAGTGKSTLLKYFRLNTKKNAVVLAPTGIAALQVNGQTIHSFFEFPPELLQENRIQKNHRKIPLFQKIDILIIDEISMVRSDMMDAIDYSLRLHRSFKAPFGGVQMVFFGDMYQLPPVVTGDLKQYFADNFESEYFFGAQVFRKFKFNVIELQKIFRQKDQFFIDMLNNIREGKILDTDMLALNKRLVPDFLASKDDLFITLASTNAIADNENQRRLNFITKPTFTYNADITGNFESKSLPTDQFLNLKVDAQVMLLKNDPDKRWVNGSIGKVIKLEDDSIQVEVNRSKYDLEVATWENIEYKYDQEEKKIVPIVKGSFTQYPLKLAWAVTIHKSQGRTFEQVVIDLGNGAFAHGQTYVALSRCTSFEGIILKNAIRPKDIIVDQKIKKFMLLKNQL